MESTNRPAKRRRTKAFRRLNEDDDALADGTIKKTITKETPRGPIEENVEIPVWCDSSNRPSTNSRDTDIPVHLPDGSHGDDNANPAEFFQSESINEESRGNQRTQTHYIQQFVDRVHPMLRSLLSREVLPDNQICGRCTKTNIAVWRCRDCTAARILCRGCIRDCHMDCPTHRIEVWTGEYFRRADLWEVGLYILVRHHTDPHLCGALNFQSTILDGFQLQNDVNEQQKLVDGISIGGSEYRGSNTPTEKNDKNNEDNEDYENMVNDKDTFQNDEIDEEESFSQFVQRLDSMYKRTHEGDNNAVREDYLKDDNESVDECIDLPSLPDNYIPSPLSAATQTSSSNQFIESPLIDKPQFDALNNPYVRVVHTNGVHHIGLVYCTCRGKENTHADLMAAGLVPTSFARYKTLFTHAVLDDFRLSNLECKTSAYQYFQKLRRQTSPMSPDNVPNLYHELRRMSRLWRWMKKLKWAGMAHRPDFTIDPMPGELANFCPACPQPGINIPENWYLEPEKWIYQRSFVADGNFKADHVRQTHPETDIWLSEGGGMTSKRTEYEEFLRTAINRLTKAPCENQFRAIELAMRLSKACDINGIVAIACARHGCFAPNSVANLPAGEQQKNVDWGLQRAIKTTNIDIRQRILFIYDIVCQYIIYLMLRIGHLLPAGLIIDAAIGLFHVHGHKDQCFYRYATTFIPGAAIVAGEILESLWSTLNSVTPAMRTATLAHRAEIMDDHMTDSNHKKMLTMATSLTDKYMVAAGTCECAQRYYQKLVQGIQKNDLSKWENEIKNAEEIRLQDRSAMDILGAKELIHVPAAAGEVEENGNSASDVDWIQLALTIEEKQIEVRDRIRRSPLNPTENDQKDVDQMRQLILSHFALLERIRPIIGTAAHEKETGPHEYDDSKFDNLDEEEHEMKNNRDDSSPYGNAFLSEEITPDTGPASKFEKPEHKKLPIPSYLGSGECNYRQAELDLRLVQAGKALSTLRDLIAEKSFQYSHVIRVAPRRGVRTRARSTIAKINDMIGYRCRVYEHCRAALVKLNAGDVTLDKFRVLQRHDISSSTALLNPNEPGSSSHRLSWIWQTGRSTDNPDTMGIQEFNRVHWLRARAQSQRWNEELILVGHEMDWTVRYYLYQSTMWKERKSVAEEMQDMGAAVYAARKYAMWMHMAVTSADQFKNFFFRSYRNISKYRYIMEQDDFTHGSPEKVQEIIFYLSSRLRVAAIASLDPENASKARNWMIPTLMYEVQWALSVCGMTAAIGNPCDIPFILRILARYLFISPLGYELLDDRELHLMLDAGTDMDDPSAVAETYKYSWWVYESEPDDSNILRFDNLDEALDHHRSVTKKFTPLAPKLNKKKYTWSRHLSSIPEGLQMKCENCRLYRGVTLGILDNLLDIRNRVHSSEVTSNNRIAMSERRAAGFFQLYETVLMKELGEQSNDEMGSVRRKKPCQSEDIEMNAAAELSRLENDPSQKWTWGTELSREEVIGLKKPILFFVPRKHSGYDVSLPLGKQGEESEGPDSPSFSRTISEVAEDIMDVPDLDSKDIPTHFTRFPLRQYLGDPSPNLNLPRYFSNDNSDDSMLSSDHGIPENFFPPTPNDNVDEPAGIPQPIDNTSDAGDLDNAFGTAADVFTNNSASSSSPDPNPRNVFTDDSNSSHSPDPNPHEAFTDDSSSSPSPVTNSHEVFTDDSISSSSPVPNPHDAFSSFNSDDNNPTAAADVFSSSESDTDLALPVEFYHASDRDVNLDIFASDSNNGSHRAADVFTSSDSDSEVPVAADAFRSHEGNRFEMQTLASQLDLVNTRQAEDIREDSLTDEGTAALPVIPGPFTAQFFSNIPATWMDPPSDEEYDPTDGDEDMSGDE